MHKPKKILESVNRVIIGKADTLLPILASILCGGHVLIEDVPGVGKTTLVKALARTLGCTFKRIQFTPDHMPSDITGLSVYDRARGEFVFKPGPIMSQIVLADEINRTSPKTQASLLEAMEEGQVTVEGATYPLPRPFLVMATQNPIGFEGTYPLPEAQLDRFMIRITLGYPKNEAEREMLDLVPEKAIMEITTPVTSPAGLLEMQRRAAETYMTRTLKGYIITLAGATRIHPALLLGISPRGSQHLYRAAKAAAFIQERDHVLPDDIKAMVLPVFTHRLILKPEARLKGTAAADVLREILQKTDVPVQLNHGD